MLRRPPTQLSLTRDDIAAYSQWREQQTQQVQLQRERQHAEQAQWDATGKIQARRPIQTTAYSMQRENAGARDSSAASEDEDDEDAMQGLVKHDDMDVDDEEEDEEEDEGLGTDEENDTLARVRDRARAAAARAAAEASGRGAHGGVGQIDGAAEAAARRAGREDSASVRRARVMGNVLRGASSAQAGRGGGVLRGRRGDAR